MEANTALAFSLPLGLAIFGLTIVALASAFALSRAVSAAMVAMARQPEAAPKIQVAMIIGCAFIEALTIYAFVIAFLSMNKFQ